MKRSRQNMKWLLLAAGLILGACSKTNGNNSNTHWVDLDRDAIQRGFGTGQLGSISLSDSVLEMDIEGDDYRVDGEVSLRIEDSYSLSRKENAILFTGYVAPQNSSEDFIGPDSFHVTFESDQDPNETLEVNGVRNSEGSFDAIVLLDRYDNGNGAPRKERIGMARVYQD